MTDVMGRRTSPPRTAERSPRRRRVRAAAGAGVVLILAAGAWLALVQLEHRDVTTETIDGPVDRLVVEVHRGDIEIVAGGEQVVVGRSLGWRLGEPEVGSSVDDGTLTLRAECPWSLPVVASCQVDHQVTVPADTHVEVRVESGSVAVAGLDGWTHVVTRGLVTASEMSGAEVIVESHGGDIAVAFAAAPSRVVLASGGGDVDLAAPGGPYDLDILSGDGQVRGELPVRAMSEATITIASDGGKVTLTATGARE